MQAYTKELSTLFTSLDVLRTDLMHSLLSAQRMENPLSEVQFYAFKARLKQFTEDVADFDRMYKRSKE